jgi:hypothetical protein
MSRPKRVNLFEDDVVVRLLKEEVLKSKVYKNGDLNKNALGWLVQNKICDKYKLKRDHFTKRDIDIKDTKKHGNCFVLRLKCPHGSNLTARTVEKDLRLSDSTWNLERYRHDENKECGTKKILLS